MPVNVDLAQFPRLVCGRCGLVALVDPEIPLDEHGSLTCPNCDKRLSHPADISSRPSTPAAGGWEPRRRKPSPVAGPVPSNAAVGLTIAAIFLLLLIVLFVALTVFSVHGPGFGSAAK
jgi:hypothetical protein